MLSRLKAMFKGRKKQPDDASSWRLTKAALERVMSENPVMEHMGIAQLDILSRSGLTSDLDKSIATDALELHKRERN